MNVLKAYLPDYLIDEIYMHLHQIHMNELIQEYRAKFKPLYSGGCYTRHTFSPHVSFGFNAFIYRTIPGGDRQPLIGNYKKCCSPIKGPKNYRYSSGLNNPNAYR